MNYTNKKLAPWIDHWYNFYCSVLFCTRFPMLVKGAGATDLYSKFNNLRTLWMLFVTFLLFGFVAWKGGVMNLLYTIAIEFGAYLAIKVGSRVESRTLILAELALAT